MLPSSWVATFCDVCLPRLIPVVCFCVAASRALITQALSTLAEEFPCTPGSYAGKASAVQVSTMSNGMKVKLGWLRGSQL